MKHHNEQVEEVQNQIEQEVENQPAEAEQPAPSAEETIAALNLQVCDLLEKNLALEKTVARLQSSADKSDTYLNQLVAIKNDFESYKRRMKFSAEQAKLEGIQSVALKLIAIADTFEIAQKHLSDENAKAFAMVHQQFMDTLQELGVEQIEVLHKEFDHMTMNALSQMDYGPENSGKVVEVYKNGYVMGEKIIRYAEVIVGQ